MKIEFELKDNYLKNKGGQINPSNPFDKVLKAVDPREHFSDFDHKENITTYIESTAKSILQKAESVGVETSNLIIPYQGKIVGGATSSNFSKQELQKNAFEYTTSTKIVIKTNAAQLLDQELSLNKWEANPIILSGNVDCYLPIENQYEITRSLLKVLWKHKHPVTIVTKNPLILRDLDIIQSLAQYDLVSVSVLINTVDDTLRQKMEPKASSVHTRLAIIDKLSNAGIPVTVLAAPIIPGLNDTDIIKLAKKVSEAGARALHHVVMPIDGDSKEMHKDWRSNSFSSENQRIANAIRALHQEDIVNLSTNQNIKGDKVIIEMINQQFKLARNLYMLSNERFDHNTELYSRNKVRQGVLF